MITEVIIVSFLKVVYPLKYPGTACLSYLDNGLIKSLIYIFTKTPVNCKQVS